MLDKRLVLQIKQRRISGIQKGKMMVILNTYIVFANMNYLI